jgi:hypothetical protein
MSSPILKSHSEISTGVQCSNCSVSIVRINWEQCTICKVFNLCEECKIYPYDKLEACARKIHIELHQNLNNDNPIDSECMRTVLITNISKNITSTQRYFNVMQEKRIHNDSDMSAITSKLKQMKNQVLTESDLEIKQEICSMIVDYHMRAYDRKIRILNLDGGGKIFNIYVFITFHFFISRCTRLYAN